MAEVLFFYVLMVSHLTHPWFIAYEVHRFPCMFRQLFSSMTMYLYMVYYIHVNIMLIRIFILLD